MVERKSLRLVVLLVDCRREAQEYERAILEFLREEGLQYLLVATKMDKMKKNEAAVAIKAYKRALQLDDDQIIGFSAVTGGTETPLGEDQGRNYWHRKQSFEDTENEDDFDDESEYDENFVVWN